MTTTRTARRLATALALTLFGGTAAAQDPAAPAEAPAPAPAAVSYKLDPQKSWLYIVVYNDTSAMASRLGHDHGIRATTFDGAVVWDTGNAGACKVDISFPVSALVVDPPGMRERAGLSADGAVSDGSKSDIKENMLGKRQLDAAAHPTITYESTACEGTTGKVKVSGNLTIHGVTKPVALTLDVKADPASFAAAGSVTVKATDFGFDPFSNLAGALRNKNEMKLVIDVAGAPR